MCIDVFFYFYIIMILHNNTLSDSFYTIAIFPFYLLFHEWVNRLSSSFFIELLACFRNTQLRSRSCILFFFFLIRFQKTISTRDKKKKKKRKTGKEWCIDWFHLWFNFVYIYFTYISKVATKVWAINLWKCHSVNIKSKALLPLGRNRCFSTSSRILVFSPQYKK